MKRALHHLAVLTVVAFGVAVGLSLHAADSPSDLARIAGLAGKAPNAADTFRFVVLSDRTGGHVDGEWADAIEQVNLLRPDFVICVGDLIEGYVDDRAQLVREWDEFDALTSELDAPFFFCPGNHDVVGKDGNTSVARAVYNERHGVEGRSYYSFDYRNCHFIVLDSMLWMETGPAADAQKAWFKAGADARRGADHLFVFYHHPQWENAARWQPLRDALPAGKTTIFNGHWHALNGMNADGIQTIVLACTAAGSAEKRATGKYRMYAHVAVDRGQPTVALVPTHQLQPGAFYETALATRRLATGPAPVGAVPAAGGTVEFRHGNPLQTAVPVALAWEAEGWRVDPPRLRASLAPNQGLSTDFTFTPTQSDLQRPTLQVDYTLPDGTSTTRTVELGIYQECPLSALPRIEVDGDGSDWGDGPELAYEKPHQMFEGREHWHGPADGSCKVRAGIVGDRLAVLVRVVDDDLRNDGPKPWTSDGIELFWDVRPVQTRNGQRGPGTGQVILVVPDTSGPIASPHWNMQKQPVPAGALFVCRQGNDGYTIEGTIPLAELGAPIDLTAIGDLAIEVIHNDRDGQGDAATVTRQSSSGIADCWKLTGAYARFRIGGQE